MFTKSWLAALTFAIVGAAISQKALAREARCLLVVKGFTAIKGKCDFAPHSGDGSFVITSYNGKYFAYVNVFKRGQANGYWNEDPYASHAHSSLGVLTREDACWVNDIASVCAW